MLLNILKWGSKVHFALIVCTVNRVKPLAALLNSLTEQVYKNFEVVIVDQNTDDRIFPIVSEFSRRLNVKYLSSDRGLSHGRNVGLAACSGDAFALVDDDSLYDPNTLLLAANALKYADVAIGSLQDLSLWFSAPGVVQRKRLRESVYSVFRGAPSATLFFKIGVWEKVGAFDEQLGAGAKTPYGSGEETDFLIRTLRAGFVVCRCPEINVWHPLPSFDLPGANAKARSYGRGRYRVIRNHDLGFFFLLVNAAYSFGKGFSMPLNFSRLRYYCNMGLGRLGL